ncbi:MAG: M48 family metallopeptidase [Rikenellaceae bacterium]
MEEEYIDDVLGAVSLRKSYRSRSLSVKISVKDDSISLTYPASCDPQEAINFLEEKRDRILEIIKRQRLSREANPPAETYDYNKLRDAALEYLPNRINEIAELTKLPFRQLRITATRSKWGSCSADNRVSLSIFLMALPKHLIDFVIIHELCHTQHHNHSPQFHALVDYICGGKEKELIKELKKHTIR